MRQFDNKTMLFIGIVLLIGIVKELIEMLLQRIK